MQQDKKIELCYKMSALVELTKAHLDNSNSINDLSDNVCLSFNKIFGGKQFTNKEFETIVNLLINNGK